MLLDWPGAALMCVLECVAGGIAASVRTGRCPRPELDECTPCSWKVLDTTARARAICLAVLPWLREDPSHLLSARLTLKVWRSQEGRLWRAR